MSSDNDSDKDVLSKLDDTVNAINSHRDWRAQQHADEEDRLNQAWQAVLDAAKALRTKLKDNPKLRYFSIAREQDQVAVSFRRTGGGSHLLTLYRHHPENKFPATMAIWVREEGRMDRRVQAADEAVQCLVQHCALNITSQ
ncbi:MAG: hypothetical protein ACSHXK_03655 [Oceanococcus sp.]